MSISGADGLYGFKNRSNGILYLSGSTLLIERIYAISDPAAEPRVIVGMLFLCINCTMCNTAKKYLIYPLFLMISSSIFILSRTIFVSSTCFLYFNASSIKKMNSSS